MGVSNFLNLVNKNLPPTKRESTPFLNKNAGRSFNTWAGSQSGFQENIPKYFRALNTLVNRSFSRKQFLKRSHLFAGVSPSFVSWRLCLKKSYFKCIKDRSSSNFIHINILFQKFFVQLCKKLYVQVLCFAIFINEFHTNSGKSSQSIDWVVNAAIEFSHSIKLIQIQDLMKLFWWLGVEQLSLNRSGSKFYFKSYIF